MKTNFVRFAGLLRTFAMAPLNLSLSLSLSLSLFLLCVVIFSLSKTFPPISLSPNSSPVLLFRLLPASPLAVYFHIKLGFCSFYSFVLI